MGRDIESNILIANFPGYLLSFIQVFDRFSDIFRPVVGLPCSLRQSELDSLTDKIAQRVSRDLDKAGTWLEMPGRPRGSAYLDLQADEEDAMANIVGASSDASDRSYRLAFGPNAGLGAPLNTLWRRTTHVVLSRWNSSAVWRH